MAKLEEMQMKYRELCAQLGDLTYKIDIFKKEASKLTTEIFELDMEYGKAKNEPTTEAGAPVQEPAVQPTEQPSPGAW